MKKNNPQIRKGDPNYRPPKKPYLCKYHVDQSSFEKLKKDLGFQNHFLYIQIK
jgi:hypothetical protein